MQGIRCITFKKILSVVIFLTCLLGMASVYAAESSAIPPEIFIGDTPNAIKIQQGMPVKIPTCFVGGTWANKEVELYVFRVQDGEYFCLGSNGWNSDYAGALEDFKPLCTVPSLPKYINLTWQAFDNTQSLSNFDLWVCVDDNIDGIPTENSIYCGHQLVVIGDNDTGARDVSDTGMAHQPPPLSGFWQTGTGEDTGSGGDDSSGSGGFQLPTPPSFPTFGSNSGGSCNFLDYALEGTTSSVSSISESLELGGSKEIRLLPTACGKAVTVRTVSVLNVVPWLHVSKSAGGSKIILDLTTTGLQAGSNYSGTVHVVTTGGISDDMHVTLRVQGQCNATSASVSPSSLSFQTSVGNTPGAKALYVRDNCGNALDATATVSSGSDWLTVKKTGTGTFSVSCNPSELSVGDYNGTITLEDAKYGQQYNVDVTLTVTDTPTSYSYSDGSVTHVSSGFHGYLSSLAGGETRYFEFTSGVRAGENAPTIQITNQHSSDTPSIVHLLVKRGSKPTPQDFTNTYGQSFTLSNTGKYQDLYWHYGDIEMVQISDPIACSKFYFMLYNSGDQSVRPYLTVSYDDNFCSD